MAGKFRNLSFFATTVQELKKSKDNLSALKEAAVDKEIQRTSKKLSNDKAKIEIDQMELDGEFDSIALDFMRNQVSDVGKSDKAQDKVDDNFIKSTAAQEKKKVDDLTDILGRATAKAKTDIAGSVMPGLDVSFQKKVGPFTFSSKKESDRKVTSVDKTLGSLKQGGFIDSFGDLNDFQDRKQAESFAASRLGPDFKKRFPRAEAFIDQQFPKKDKFGFSIGQKRDVKGKGEFEYIGNNQWKRSPSG